MKTILKVMMLSGCLFVNMLMQAEENVRFYYWMPTMAAEYTGKAIGFVANGVKEVFFHYPIKLSDRCTKSFAKGLLGENSSVLKYTGYGLKTAFTAGIIGGGYLLGRKVVEKITQVVPLVRLVKNEFEKGIESSNPNKVESNEKINEKAVWFTDTLTADQKQKAIEDLTLLKNRAAFKPLHMFGIAKSIENIINDRVNGAIHTKNEFEYKVQSFSAKVLQSYKVRGLWFVGFDKAAKEAIDLYVRICLKLYELDKKP